MPMPMGFRRAFKRLAIGHNADGPMADGPTGRWADGLSNSVPKKTSQLLEGADGPMADGPMADGPMADGDGFRRRWRMADGPMAGSPMPMADADGLKSLLNNLTYIAVPNFYLHKGPRLSHIPWNDLRKPPTRMVMTWPSMRLPESLPRAFFEAKMATQDLASPAAAVLLLRGLPQALFLNANDHPWR